MKTVFTKVLLVNLFLFRFSNTLLAQNEIIINGTEKFGFNVKQLKDSSYQIYGTIEIVNNTDSIFELITFNYQGYGSTVLNSLYHEDLPVKLKPHQGIIYQYSTGMTAFILHGVKRPEEIRVDTSKVGFSIYLIMSGIFYNKSYYRDTNKRGRYFELNRNIYFELDGDCLRKID